MRICQGVSHACMLVAVHTEVEHMEVSHASLFARGSVMHAGGGGA